MAHVSFLESHVWQLTAYIVHSKTETTGMASKWCWLLARVVATVLLANSSCYYKLRHGLPMPLNNHVCRELLLVECFNQSNLLKPAYMDHFWMHKDRRNQAQKLDSTRVEMWVQREWLNTCVYSAKESKQGAQIPEGTTPPYNGFQSNQYMYQPSLNLSQVYLMIIILSS